MIENAIVTININQAGLILISQLANGGLRDAQSLLDQLSLLEGEITPERIWDLVGATSELDLIELLRAIAGSDPVKIIEKCRNILNRGREPLIILQNLASFYLNLSLLYFSFYFLVVPVLRDIAN